MSIIAMALAIMFAVVVMIATRYGWGIHCWDFDRSMRPAYLKMEISIVTVYLATIYFVKISILFLYIRIFGGSSRLVLYSAWALFGLLTISTICLIFLAIFACNPVASYWHPDMHGKCLNSITIGIISIGVSIVTDILIFILPLRQIWKLHLPVRQKIGVIGVLATGLLACIVNVVRVHSIVALGKEYDVTWHTGSALRWT
ncbi:MAG: hypothetical protein M1816_004736 [Peltula sp. TS41687]|nr:MAG: hypothetical protein M1816_004736 [Peltula sp. TS41687]